MGVSVESAEPGQGFITGLTNLLGITGMRGLAMSSFGIKKEDCAKIADMTVNNTGIDDMDRYPEPLTVADVQKILEQSYK